MDSIKDVAGKHKLARKKDPKLHSAAHLLADELSQQMNDRAHFGLYLKMAVTHPPDLLRKIAGEVLENPKVQHKGRLFSYLIKKHNDTYKQPKD
jgi:hypothetical protein